MRKLLTTGIFFIALFGLGWGRLHAIVETDPVSKKCFGYFEKVFSYLDKWEFEQFIWPILSERAMSSQEMIEHLACLEKYKKNSGGMLNDEELQGRIWNTLVQEWIESKWLLSINCFALNEQMIFTRANKVALIILTLSKLEWLSGDVAEELEWRVQRDTWSAILCYAIHHNLLFIAQFFIAEGVDMNQQNCGYYYEGTCALHNVQCDQVAQWLIEKGADIHVIDKHGNTPLHSAVERGDLKTVKLLIDRCIYLVNVKNNSGETPLHIAIKSGNIEIAQFLLCAGLAINPLR